MDSPPDRAIRVYRIVSSRYPPFDGSGTFRWGSRWISPGRYVAHAAESYALAVLENLVHWQTGSVPGGSLCVAADIPGDVAREELDRRRLPKAEYAGFGPFREIGDDWYRRGETAILRVPSVISPVEANILVNQSHEDFARIAVRKPIAARIDPRLRGTDIP